MKVHAKVQNNELTFSSPLARQRFFETHNGKDVLIEADEAPTAEMRRFFEGCLVPVMYYSHPKTGWNSFKDAREALKLEFLPPRTVTSVKGHSVRITPSTTELTKERFKIFVNVIVEWMVENQIADYTTLDAEAYKAWRDSAPGVDEIYPPLERLKASYESAKFALTPPWRK